MNPLNLPPPKSNKLPREQTRAPRQKRLSTTWQDRRRRYLLYNGRIEQLRKEGLQ